MEERRKRTNKKDARQATPQKKIEELKKDIEAFQKNVENVLKEVPADLPENLCIACENPTMDYEELVCHHVLCHKCCDNLSVCPLCRPTRFDSSSSSEDL